MTRQELLQRAAHFGPPIKTALEAPETVVEQVPTPFFTKAGIYRVSTRPPARPFLFVLGLTTIDTILLNNNSAGFFKLASEGGLNLALPETRTAYVVTFLETTRDFTGGIQILRSIEESWWLKTMTQEEAKRKAEVIEKYKSVVHPPKLSEDSTSTVVLFVIRDRALLKLRAKIEPTGQIAITETVLEPEVPVVYLR